MLDKLIRSKYIYSSSILMAMAFLGGMHILMRISRYSINIAGDSYAYMRYAEGIISGDFFYQKISGGEFLEEKGIWYPPFFSIILAFFRTFEIDVIDTSRLLNAIAFSLTILLAGYYLNHHLRSKFLMFTATFTIMLSFPIVATTSHVLTDTLFILLTLLAVIHTESFWSGRTGRSSLYLAATFSALASLTRWVGVVVIFTGIIFIFMRPTTTASKRYENVTLYSALSSLPLAFWLIRNLIVGGNLVGERGDFASNQSLSDSLSQIGYTLYRWTFFPQHNIWMECLLWAAAALAVFETMRFLIVRLDRSRFHTSTRSSNGNDKVKIMPEWRATIPFVTFTIIYIMTLVIVVPITVTQGITSRYLAPVWVPVIIISAILLETFWLTTYRNSGILAHKIPVGWSIRYNKSSGKLALPRWGLIFLIFIVILVHNISNISFYIDILITYDYNKYLLTQFL